MQKLKNDLSKQQAGRTQCNPQILFEYKQIEGRCKHKHKNLKGRNNMRKIEEGQNNICTRTVKAGQKYRHFKGNEYLIVVIAKHTETLELYVVYEALYGDGGVFVRPYDMFISEVDHEKYPDVAQKYRFELVE